MEQEPASIAKFILSIAATVETLEDVYYWEIPEGFKVPSIFFPEPEIDTTGASTLSSYELRYAWYPVIFHSSTALAYALAQEIVEEIRSARNLIPLYDVDGTAAGVGLRINDPSAKKVEDGTYQLDLSWTCSRQYYREPSTSSGTPVIEFN